MELTPILYFEASAGLLLAACLLCAKPEYGLFLYGLALGFPDAAIPLGTVINLRFDDALLLLFLLRTILWTTAPVSQGQRKILWWQASFLFACFFSAVVGIAQGTPPGAYEDMKMVGCAAIVYVLPRIIQSERRLRFLIAGLMCAGVALALQMILRLGASSANFLSNTQELKEAATFTTWNPNTIGQAAMLVVFAARSGWLVFEKSHVSRILYSSLSIGFAMIPALVFVRGTTFSIAAGFILFFALLRAWKSLLVFFLVCFSVVSYMRAVDPGLVDDATHVDFATGEGLSHRLDRWDMAVEAIQANPLLGQGFGQEWAYLSAEGSEGRAHNAFLTAWLELGIGGLVLLLAVVYQFVSVGISLYKKTEFQLCGALVLALIAAAFLDSFGLPTLYWEKLPTISLSIAVALIGICEKNGFQGVPLAETSMEMESLAQHI
jgi:O-antigen ligase